jgi:hypothetical protein
MGEVNPAKITPDLLVGTESFSRIRVQMEIRVYTPNFNDVH